MSQTGVLIDSKTAIALSRKIYLLGDQVHDIYCELDRAGYGAGARVIRNELEALASTPTRVQQLRLYWCEYAKERIAGLVGPMNILAGRIPEVAAYRSPVLEDLRVRASAGEFESNGQIKSPQIEPTIKKYIETLPDDPFAIRLNDAVKRARQEAVGKLSLPELEGFDRLNAKVRYDLLVERYSAHVLSSGFSLDSHRRTGVVFRRLTSDGKWAFVFVDDSRDGVDVGMLSVKFGLTLPKKAVLPSALPSCLVASFAGDDIVPGFEGVRGFATDSYAEFCLAADACAYLAGALYRRVDMLLR